MNLLNPRQIECVLASRLPGFKISCTHRKEDVISLCLRDRRTREVFGVSGIRPSAYKGRYGALILAKLLMENIQGLRNPDGQRPGDTSASNEQPERSIFLSLISNE